MQIRVREKVKGSGNYYLFLNENGTRRSMAIGSREIAEKLKEDLHYQYITGAFDMSNIPQPGQTMRKAQTFEDYAKSWIDSADWLKPQTKTGYRSIINRHLVPPLGHLQVKQIDQKAVKSLLSGLQSAGMSHARIMRVKATLSSILNSVAQDDDFPGFVNPALAIRVHKDHAVKSAVPEPFSPDELRLYLSTMKDVKPEYYPLFFLLSRTGMRIGEALALQWPDVLLAEKKIRVRQSWGSGSYTTPKSGRTRIVPLTPDLHSMLSVLKSAHTISDPKQSLVFPGKAGNPQSAGNLYSRAHVPVLMRAGLRHIRIHDLRHTYATLLLREGCPLVDVSKLLGHSTVNLTAQTYYHALKTSDDVAILDQL